MSSLAALVLALFLVPDGPGQDASRLGQPVEPPPGRKVESTYGFLAAPPAARVTAPGRIRIELRTSEPTPPGIAYYGISTLDEDLDWPRYRAAVAEEGEPLDLRSAHVIELPFDRLTRRMPNTPYEPKITWRVELWLPTERSSRFVEGRVYFDPETLGDTVNVTLGPFVDQVGPWSAIVSWETDRVADGRVWIAGREVRSPRQGTRHEIRVEGLQPGTRYGYRVQSGATLTRSYALRTASPDAFRFAAMSDSREGLGGGLRNFGGTEALALRTLGTEAYRRGADFVLFPGDLINGYTTSVGDFELQLDAWRSALGPLHARIPIYECMGNHEALIDLWRTPDGGTFWFDRPGDESAEAAFARAFVNPENGPSDEGPGTPTYRENVYWFDWGPARFLVLNNNYWWSSDPDAHGGNMQGYILPAQMEWLREQVAVADRVPRIRHLFVSAQEPPFPTGGHTRDSMWYTGGDTNGDGEVDDADIPIVENRNELWSILSGSKKTVAFLTGDEHSYCRLLVGPDTPVGHRRGLDGEDLRFRYPVWQITAAGAGAPWYDKDLRPPWSGGLRAHSTQPHVAIFSVEKDRVELEVRSQTGQLLDSAVLRERGRLADGER